MIPTLILFGLALGRWWRTALVVAAVAWPALLVTSDIMDVSVGLLGAAALAVANTAVGVAVHQAVRAAVRHLGRGAHVPWVT